MGKRTVMGSCSICGKEGPLSEEHVPPRKAFNSFTVIEYKWEDVYEKRKSKGKQHQGGARNHTLCASCNNATGSWYAAEYVTWARTLNDVLNSFSRQGVKQGTIGLPNVFPLRFLKQTVTCFFSLFGEYGGKLGGLDSRLINFVLEKENQALPEGFRFFLNLYPYSPTGTPLRRWPLAAKITFDKKTLKPLRSEAPSEISHPPLQLVMTVDGTDFRGTDITYFKHFGYNERANLDLPLQVVGSSSPLPTAT